MYTLVGQTTKKDIRGKTIKGFNFAVIMSGDTNSAAFLAHGEEILQSSQFDYKQIKVRAKLHRDNDIITLFDDNLFNLHLFTNTVNINLKNTWFGYENTMMVSIEEGQQTAIALLPVVFDSAICLMDNDYISIEVIAPKLDTLFIDEFNTGETDYFKTFHILTNEIESDEIEIGVPVLNDMPLNSDERLQEIHLGNNISKIFVDLTAEYSNVTRAERPINSFTLYSDIFKRRDSIDEHIAKNYLFFADQAPVFDDTYLQIYNDDENLLNDVNLSFDLAPENFNGTPVIYYATLIKEEAADQKAQAMAEIRAAKESQRLGVELPKEENDQINELKTALKI